MDDNKNQNPVLLFVDDEINIINSIKREVRYWAKEKSAEILTANSASEALQLIESRAGGIDVIVSDLKMPQMLGSDFLLNVKLRWPDIVTILLTGFSETQEIMKAIKAGIFSYIMKPWEPEYLLSELEKALEVKQTKLQNEKYARQIQEELRWAGEMQKALLRPNLKSSAGVEFRVSYQAVPGLFCSGDYYDVINLPGERFLILIGDVAGHGVKAALITAIMKAVIFPEYVRNAQNHVFSPAAFMAWLNERMSFELQKASDMMITFFAAILDMKTKCFTYANAGHNRPILLRDDVASTLPVAGPAIGFSQSVIYVEQAETIRSGDRLLLFTDGLIEIVNGEVSRDNPDLRLIAQSLGDTSDFHKRLLEAVLGQAKATAFTDDVTILTAKVL